MKTLASFESVVNAHILKGRLEAEGIYCEITGEAVAQVLPPISPIELKVTAEDYERALAIMEELNF